MSDLEQIGDYAQVLLKIDDLIESKESELKELQRRKQEVHNLMKETMLSKNIPELVYQNRRIKLKPFLSAKVVNDCAFEEWLIGKGDEGLLKVKLEFPAKADISGVLGYADANRISYRRESGIHHQTLQKYIRDLKKDGKPLPSDDVVSIYEDYAVQIEDA